MGIVTGVFIYPNGSPVANGVFQWKLSADAVELGTACVAPVLIGGSLDSNGNMTSTFAFNDILGTAGGTNTTYQLTIKDVHGGQVWNENYYLTGTSANVNLVLPGSGTAGQIFFPVFPAFAADTVQTATATGAIGFGGGINTLIKATAGAGISLTAVSAVGVTGQTMKFVMTDTGTSGVSIILTGGQTISGQSSWKLTNQWQYLQMESDNANWIAVAFN